MPGDEGIDPKAEDQRQGEAVAAAAKCQGRIDTHTHTIFRCRGTELMISIRSLVIAKKAAGQSITGLYFQRVSGALVPTMHLPSST